jgi:hypothetical protein
VESNTQDLSLNKVFVQTVTAGSGNNTVSKTGESHSTENQNTQPLAVGVRVVPLTDKIRIGMVHIDDIHGQAGNERVISYQVVDDA